MRELTNEEDDNLELAKIREKKLKERGPAKFRTEPASPSVKKDVTVRLYNPAYAKHLPQPTSCPLCRSELDGDFIEAKTLMPSGLPGQEIALWHCSACHNNFGILIGMYVNPREGAVTRPNDQPAIGRKAIGRKVDGA